MASKAQSEVAKWFSTYEVKPLTPILTRVVYGDYSKWAEEHGVFVRSPASFGIALSNIVPRLEVLQMRTGRLRNRHYIFPNDDFDELL
jgi:hypothetical protein